MIDLHDAVIDVMSFDWKKKRFALDITPLLVERSSPCRLSFTDVRSVSWTRKDEWGPSASIFEVNVTQEGDLQRFLIQMQSGDVVDVVALEVEELDIDAGANHLGQGDLR